MHRDIQAQHVWESDEHGRNRAGLGCIYPKMRQKENLLIFSRCRHKMAVPDFQDTPRHNDAGNQVKWRHGKSSSLGC